MNTVQGVARNTSIIIIGNIIFRLLSLFLIIYLARYLGVESFGKYNFVFAFIAFFGVITDLGIRTIVVREISYDSSKAQKLLGNVFIMKLVLSFIAVILAIIVISIMQYPADTTTYVYITAFSLIFISITDFYTIIFQEKLRMEYEIIAKLSFKVFSLFLILWIIFSKGTLLQIILAVLLSEVVKTIVSFSFSRKFYRPYFEIDFNLWKRLIREILPLALSNIILIIYFRVDVLMLSIMIGDKAVGLYSSAYKLCEPFAIIPRAFMFSALPLMSSFFKKSEKGFEKSYKLSYKYLLIIILPIAIFVTLFSKKIIFLVYGQEFSESAVALGILIWTVVLSSGFAVFQNLLISSGNQKYVTYTSLFAAFGNVSLNLLFIPTLSYLGASIASLITSFIVFVMSFYFVSFKYSTLPIHKIALRPIISSLMMAISIFLLFSINIYLTILIAIIVYFISLILVGTFTDEDIIIFEKLTGKNIHYFKRLKNKISEKILRK